MKFTSISMRLATPEDAHLPVFDNTKLTALDTCVRWGILSYQMHKKWPGSKKSSALDAGTALHEVFAGVRLYQLYHYDLEDSNCINTIIENQGLRLFGKHRWHNLDLQNSLINGTNTRETLADFCLQILHTSGYESPEDSKDKRTMSALEEVTYNYINRWDMYKYPIWIRDKNDPNTDVGIEIGFELVIEFESLYTPPEAIEEADVEGIKQSYRFTGKLDGLHYDPTELDDLNNPTLFVVDNKTTSRIMEDWGMQYEMDTQTVGYMLASKVFTETDVNQAKIFLSSVPVPKTSVHGGQAQHSVYKDTHHFEAWFKWFYELAQIEQQYKDNPIEAPVSPFSCIRYFKPCSMLPFCTANNTEKVEALEQMETYEWNVLAKVEEE